MPAWCSINQRAARASWPAVAGRGLSEGLGISAFEAGLADLNVLARLCFYGELWFWLETYKTHEAASLSCVCARDDGDRFVVGVVDAYDVLPPEKCLPRFRTPWVAALWDGFDPDRLIRVMFA